MNKLFAMMLLVTASAVGAQTNQPYTLTWIPSASVFTGPTNVTMPPDSYYFYFSTNPATPITNWTYAGSVPATTVIPGNSNYVAISRAGFTVAMQPPVFATMTYSNSQGVCPFSNLAGLQAFPSPALLRAVSSP